MQRFLLSVFLVCLVYVAGQPLELSSSQLPGGDTHAYFNELSARPEKRYSYSLRDQAEIDQYLNGRLPSGNVTYQVANDDYRDRQDAAKVVVHANQESIEQVRLPVALASGDVWIVWDAWFGREWAEQPVPFVTTAGVKRPGLLSHKAWQIASPLDNSERYLEIRTHYSLSPPPNVAVVDLRAYAKFGPGTSRGGSERVEPLLAIFHIHPATWTRFVAKVELESANSGTFDRFSLWVADETRPFVQLYDRLSIKSAGRLTNFWLEYNSSQPRIGGPLVGYARNVVVLQDLTNPGMVFRQPGPGTAGSFDPSGGPLSPPRNLRLVRPF